MELKKIIKQVYYIPNSTNIGVVKDGANSVILIDTGIDKDTGRRILRLLEQNGLSLKAIINTHSHADHCGGNQFIKQRTKVPIYAPAIESAIINHTILEPIYLFSGASPIPELKNKFLMAKPSIVDYVLEVNKPVKFDHIELNIIPLPGHSPNQVGIEATGVLFCADAIFSEEILSKHKIPFFTDILRTKESLIFLRDSKYQYYVPSHASLQESITELAIANLKAINSVEEHILERVVSKQSTEQVLKGICDQYNIQLKNVGQYYLMNTVVMAFLSSLRVNDKVKLDVVENTLYWERVQ